MLRNQLSQADSYLAGIARERARLVREDEAHVYDLKHLNGLPRTREVQERINGNQNRRDVAELELNRLDREERKTLELIPRYNTRIAECARLMELLESSASH